MARRRPFFVQRVEDQHPDKHVKVWFQDEARFGQQGTLTNVWDEKGSRPTAVRQTEYEWCYLFASVNPLTGESSALITPTVNTDTTNAHLRFISEPVGPGRHVVRVLDRAGRHVSQSLKVSDNITPLHPPYSPELNCIERLWLYLRDHYLGNRIFADEDVLGDARLKAWNHLDPQRLARVCHTDWIAQGLR